MNVESTQSELGRYSSHCRERNIKKKKQCISYNVQFEEYENYRVYLIATKDIKAGEEIFTDYGNEYWEES